MLVDVKDEGGEGGGEGRGEKERKWGRLCFVLWSHLEFRIII